MSVIIDGTNGISDVDGSASTPAIRGTDANTGIFFPAADTIAFAEGGAEAMRIDSDGDVGIGTSSPTTRLDVVTASSNAYIRVARNAQSSGQVGLEIDGGTSGTDWYVYQPTSSNNLAFFGNGSDRALITSGGNFQFDSGYGSPATAYGCRAWVNFNGTGTVAIRASGNVTIITDNGVGDYTVNFTTAMVDANYCVQGLAGMRNYISAIIRQYDSPTQTTSSVRLTCAEGTGSLADTTQFNVSIYR